MDTPSVHPVSIEKSSDCENSPPDVKRRIATLTRRIEKKMVSVSSNAKAATAACLLLKELRTYVHISADNQTVIMESRFVEKLLCLLPRCVEHRVLVSDSLRCVMPFVRSPTFKHKVCELMSKYQFIKTLLVLLRRQTTDDNISTQCIELMYTVVDHHCRYGLDINSLVNFIVMHGGLTILPQLLIRFEALKQELSLRRTISCLIFLIKHTSDGADMSTRLGATSSNGMVDPLLRLIAERQDVVRVHSLILLLGLMQGSDGTCAAVIKKGALGRLVPIPLPSQGLPSAWLLQAQARCESMGADANVLSPEDAPEISTDGPCTSDAPVHENSPSALIASGKYNHDGYWPPFRRDHALGDGRIRPATGYDNRIPNVVDRLFASPIARSTTEKEIRKVKAEMNRKTYVSRGPNRPVTQEGTPGNWQEPDGTDGSASGLVVVANTLFNEEEDANSAPVVAKHAQKLSYAEKLQAMIMQVQDTVKEIEFNEDA